MKYLPYILILAAFCILFVRARGLFSAAARYLHVRSEALARYISEETLKRMLLILFAANLLGAFMTWRDAESDTAAKGYLVRNEYGSNGAEAELTVTLDGEKQDVELPVAARRMDRRELRKVLADRAGKLEKMILGDMDAGHVDRDLTLPEKAGNPSVKISSDTSNAALMDWEGVLGPEVPPEGAEVKLTATLSIEEEEVVKEIKLKVYPRPMDDIEKLQQEVRDAVQETNDETEETVHLPENVGGKKAVWSQRQGNTGMILLLFGFLIAALYAYSKVRAGEKEAEKRDEEMLIDYPNIVSKLVLLLTAGMSLRKAFARIRTDYRDTLRHGAPKRAGYEEIVRMSLEMEHGVSELVAYENMGKRCRVNVYRTFSTLLVQNLTKGGDEMAAILSREAQEAYEDRKKRARILGEEAGTKLLLPMLLMLAIVMAILMIPAFFAFL